MMECAQAFLCASSECAASMNLDTNAILRSVLPFGAIFAADNNALGIGRTLRKIMGRDDLPTFFELFTVQRPRSAVTATRIDTLSGKRLTLRMAAPVGPVDLRGHITRVGEGLFLLDVSLETDLSVVVEQLGLEEKDFSFSDPSVDMLYLLEAQTALLEDSQNLAVRLKDAKDAAEALARTDPLTELPNRRASELHLKRILQREISDRAGGALLHIDLDRFKNANDTLGHAAGDAILKHVANCLFAALGPDDLAARIGGDEFVIVLGAGYSEESLRSFANDVITAISVPVTIENQSVEVGASIGMTWLDKPGVLTLDDLFLEADIALYEAKAKGRGQGRLYDQRMSERLQLSQRLARDLEAALGCDEFVPYFQIQIDAGTRELFGVEVLARWQHPALGLLPPGQFLYVAERAKLTETIDRRIYRAALSELAGWSLEGIAPPHMSLNITADQLASEDFVANMIALVGELGLDPGMITFELLETILLDDLDEAGGATEGAERLAWAGFGLALDDFGTGRASIASLVSLPSPLVKIDRRFITEIDINPRQERLTHAIVSLAQDLGLSVMAEGVERQAEADKLLSLGCKLHQGFLYGRPEDAKTTASLLDKLSWEKRGINTMRAG